MKVIIATLFFLGNLTLISQFSVGIQSGLNIPSQVKWINENPKESWINSFMGHYRINKSSQIGIKLSFSQNRDEYNYNYLSNYPYYQNDFYSLPSDKSVRLNVRSNFSRISLNYSLNTDLSKKIYYSFSGGIGLGYLYSINVYANEKNPYNLEVLDEIYFIKGETDRNTTEFFLEGGASLNYNFSDLIDFSFNTNLLISLQDLNEGKVPVVNNLYEHYTTIDENKYQTINLSFTLGMTYKFNTKQNEN